MLMIVFLIPFTTQANIISTPSYQVDVLQTAIGIKSDNFAVFEIVNFDDSMRSLSQDKNIDLTFKMTAIKSEPKIILFGQCASYSSSAISKTEVSGGDFVGIRQPS